MNKETASEDDIERRYLCGLLSPDELEHFESRLMDDPELLEKLELDSVMYKFMPQVRETELPSKFWQFLELPLRRVLAPVMVTMIIVPMITLSLFNEPGVSTIRPVFLLNESYRSSVDSSDDIASLTYRDEQEVILLMLYPADEIADKFNVSVVDLSSETQHTFTHQIRGESGYISIQLPASTIDEGRYNLEITPVVASSENPPRIKEILPIRVIKNN